TSASTPVAIVDTDISLTDSNNDDIFGATIHIENAVAGDEIALAGSLPNGVNFSYDAESATAFLSGAASVSDYEGYLQLLRFDANGSTDITPREITISVNDGAANSTVVTTTVSLDDNQQAGIDDLNTFADVNGNDVLTETCGKEALDEGGDDETPTQTRGNETLDESGDDEALGEGRDDKIPTQTSGDETLGEDGDDEVPADDEAPADGEGEGDGTPSLTSGNETLGESEDGEAPAETGGNEILGADRDEEVPAAETGDDSEVVLTSGAGNDVLTGNIG